MESNQTLMGNHKNLLSPSALLGYRPNSPASFSILELPIREWMQAHGDAAPKRWSSLPSTPGDFAGLFGGPCFRDAPLLDHRSTPRPEYSKPSDTHASHASSAPHSTAIRCGPLGLIDRMHRNQIEPMVK